MKLEMKEIHKSFGAVEVLHGVSFSVETGRALGLLGRNGAGKTTSIRILMDVFHADSGAVLIDGKEFQRSRYSIGYLPEERGLYPKKTVSEQMIYLAQLRGMTKTEARKSMLYWLHRLNISEYMNRNLETLSKGNQQKVQLAATLVANPDIVILDEPFSGLDPVNAQILKNVVRELIEKGCLVIFSSHQMSYVEEFCEDIVIINKGEVVLSGHLDEIKTTYGRNRVMVEAAEDDGAQLEKEINEKLSHISSIHFRHKKQVVCDLKQGVTKEDFMKELVNSGIAIDSVGSYKPSLNDIFVNAAGNGEVEEDETV